MKLKNLEKLSKKELKEDKNKKAVEILKESIKDIASAKRTLKRLEANHKKLLKMDVEDLEDDFEY